MKISELLNQDKPLLSFEVFPPKAGSPEEPILQATEKITRLHPAFMSVTYGAGGGNSKKTISIAQRIQSSGVPALAHLTCIRATEEEIDARLEEMKKSGIDNILALRGDRPLDMTGDDTGDFPHASDLVKKIRERGDFCIGGACYPEGHTECADRALDLENLKIKVENGCNFLTTQMFFDNSILYSFLYRLREKNIDVPVIAGIMPVTNAKQIKRSCELSGTSLPSRFRMIADKFGADPAAMKQAGIAYATEQIIDLFANGVNAVHVYTMNKPDVAQKIRENLSDILK